MAPGGFPSSTPSLRGCTVLVVDADARTRALVSAMLRYCGAVVWAVASTEDAMTAIGEIIPGVIVTTVGPPGGSAATLVERLRALPPEQGAKTRVIGVGPSLEADAARTSGVDTYLHLPIDVRTLCGLIAELTSGWKLA
jgi:CheY-like chemotaxis protein